MKKEIPILFSTAMVEAILNETKTMTRRAIKQKPIDNQISKWKGKDGSVSVAFRTDLTLNCTVECPHGKIGDLLWVREEHKVWTANKYWHCEFKNGEVMEMYYKSLPLVTLQNLAKRKTLGKWQRARFMPKALCRIWLEITEIKVEHLQDISEEDAIAEGIKYNNHTYPPVLFNYLTKQSIHGGFPSVSFKTLWQSINGTESWDSNPWVWVVKFKVLSTSGKPANL